ncbi:AraC family transcriptional regulator [Paenibacillus oryzisoli]|uniref:AraC family transcriptional regulator n=1 Tax=Paenibacillus oryzisoli TaxID=1850517 RepID=UPI003D2B5AEF
MDTTLKKIRELYNVDLLLEHTTGTDKTEMNYYHFHNVYEIYLAVTPGAEMWIGNQRYTVSPNDLFLLSTSDQHRVVVHDRKHYERFILYFNSLYIQPLCSNNANLLDCFGLHNSKRIHCLKLAPEESLKLISLYRQLTETQAAVNTYAWEIKVKIMLVEILIFINEVFLKGFQSDQALSATSHHVLANVMEYINGHYHKEINAEHVSERFGLNRHQLNQLFKEITGIPFHKYLVNTRIIKARELLEQDDISTTQACYDSGFNDYAHFIRTFSKAVGVSPGKYARQYRKHE